MKKTIKDLIQEEATLVNRFTYNQMGGLQGPIETRISEKELQQTPIEYEAENPNPDFTMVATSTTHQYFLRERDFTVAVANGGRYMM